MHLFHVASVRYSFDVWFRVFCSFSRHVWHSWTFFSKTTRHLLSGRDIIFLGLSSSLVYHPKLFCSPCPYLPVSDVAFSETLWQHLSQMKLVFGVCGLIKLPAVSLTRDYDVPSCCCAFGSSTALYVFASSCFFLSFFFLSIQTCVLTKKL